MAKQNIEFKVGVVILAGLIILAVSLYWLQGYRLKMNSRMMHVVFDDVGTLAVGDNVTVSGVRRGKVNDLRLTPEGVEVELQLNRDVMLKRDAQIVIKNMGLMGERFIAITPGRDSVEFDYSRPAVGLYDPGLPEVMGLMGEMIVELRSLVASVKQTIGSDTSLSRFTTMVGNLEKVSESLVAYVERNESKLDHTAENLLHSSQELSRLFKDNAARVDSTAVRVDRASARVEQIVAVLDTLATSARQFADYLDNPEGSLQLMMEDRRLYDDLRRTSNNIDELIADIRANPRKYINLTLELF